MKKSELIMCYEKEIEIFLGGMNIFKGNKIYNTDSMKNKINREYILDEMTKMKAGNVDREALEKAVDNLLPYLYEINL